MKTGQTVMPGVSMSVVNAGRNWLAKLVPSRFVSAPLPLETE